jgi:hypothetical protein
LDDRNELTTECRLLIRARMWIADQIKESGGCDHSVGICVCADVGFLNEIDRHLINRFKLSDLMDAFYLASPTDGFTPDGDPKRPKSQEWQQAAASAVHEYARVFEVIEAEERML